MRNYFLFFLLYIIILLESLLFSVIYKEVLVFSVIYKEVLVKHIKNLNGIKSLYLFNIKYELNYLLKIH